MSHPIVDLTRELLNCGVFSHLPDNDLSQLHWIILKDGTPETLTSRDELVGFWYRGDYYSSNIHPRLLQRCNEFLQRLGRPMIDVNCEEFLEA
jgi:hypothetical protein